MHECFVWFSLSSERFIEVFVPRQKSKQSGHVYVIGVSSVPLTFFFYWILNCTLYHARIGLSSLSFTIIFFIGF
jgi:hypothetical protein